MYSWLLLFSLAALPLGKCFITGSVANVKSITSAGRGYLTMTWQFSKGSGSLKALGGRGTNGEFYYIPSKRPSLKAPPDALGNTISIPIFPRNQVLSPVGEEYLGVYEMRYRQLVNDVAEGGLFGHVYYSQENQKLALVGTLARIKGLERLEDGGVYVKMQGVGRFYLKDIKAEKPYLRARVQVFNDFSENEPLIQSLEQGLLNEIRYSVLLMKMLYPKNNYSIIEAVLRNRPKLPEETALDSIRIVDLPGEITETERRCRFSFACMDMLKTDAVTKLLFLQEPVLEKRYASMIKVLEESTAFLEGELKRRGVITDGKIATLKQDSLKNLSDVQPQQQAASWVPENFVEGDWMMKPSMMD